MRQDTISQVRATEAALTQQVDRLVGTLSDFTICTDRIESRVESAVDSSSTMASKVKATAASLLDISSHLGRMASKVDGIENRCANSSGELGRMHAAVQAAGTETGRLHDVVEAVRGELSVDLRQARTTLDRLRHQMAVEATRIRADLQENDKLQSAVRGLTEKLNNIRDELRAKDHALASRASDADRLAKDVTDLRSQLDTAQERAASCQDLDTLANYNAILRSEQDALRKAVCDLQSRLAEAESEAGDSPDRTTRKWRRTGSPSVDPRSNWDELVSSVAVELHRMESEAVGPIIPQTTALYYQLSVDFLNPAYQSRWKDFIQTDLGTAFRRSWNWGTYQEPSRSGANATQIPSAYWLNSCTREGSRRHSSPCRGPSDPRLIR